MIKRILVALTLLALIFWPAAAFAQHVHGIPDFCAGSPDTVKNGQTRVIDAPVTAPCVRVETGGTLEFRSGGRLASDMVFVLPGGRVLGGTASAPLADFTLTIRPAPITDPEQYGRGLISMGVTRLHGTPLSETFVRLAAEPAAGQAMLTLAQAPTGWKAGDTLVIPGTSQGFSTQWETPTVASVSGVTVTLAAPLQYAHRGARDATGTLRFLPHVGNLTRSVVIRSENPAIRAHVMFTGDADVDVRYVRFQDMGRTTIAPIDNGDPNAGRVGTNQIGRYLFHLHHAFKAQQQVIGNALVGGTKGGLVIHNTSFSTFRDNVIYDVDGAGIVLEAGTETQNVIDHNFVVRVEGTGNDRCDDRPILQQWHCGSGLWTANPDNFIRNNVYANNAAWVHEYMMLGVDNVLIQPGPGQPASVPTDMRKVPLRQDENNEGWSSGYGWTLWNYMAFCCAEVFDGPWGTFKGVKVFHSGTMYYSNYGSNKLIWEDGVFLGHPDALNGCGSHPRGFHHGDYIVKDEIIRNFTVHNLCEGLLAPYKTGDPRSMFGGSATGHILIEGGSFRNASKNIVTDTMYGVTGGDTYLAPRKTTLQNVVFGPAINGAVGTNVQVHFSMSNTNPNILQLDQFFIENAGKASQVFLKEQAPDFVIPPNTTDPRVNGLTNQQAWAQFQRSIAGAVLPSGCTTVGGIDGVVCGAIVPVPQSTVVLDPNTRFQTIQRWELTAAASDFKSFTPAHFQTAADLAVNDLNFTRARIEIHNGAEGNKVAANPGRYTPINDNADPNVLDLTKFDWSFYDTAIDTIVLPLRAKAAAAGKTIFLDLRYVDHIANTSFEHWQNPAEYGEFMVAVFTHTQQKYGFVPDSINVVNEPDNFADYAGQGVRLGQMIVAAAAKLQASGFAVPQFSAPSTTSMGNVAGLFDGIASVPGALALLSEVGYHRYNSAADPNEIVSRAVANGKRTAMLEFWGPSNTAAVLRTDLTDVRASAWNMALIMDDYGCASGQVFFLDNGVVTMCPPVRAIRQYTKFVNPGAVRIATSGPSAFKPVAFINSDGRYVVVVQADASSAFAIRGLPAGTYGVYYANTMGGLPVTGSDVVATAGQDLSVSIPFAGWITVYAKSGGSQQQDSDGDGVLDVNDKCPGTPSGTPVDPNSGCPVTVPSGTIDTATSGSWIGVYGADGHALASETPALPAGVTLTVTGSNPVFTWEPTTTDPRALQRPGGASRLAAAWYQAGAMTFDLSLGSTPRQVAFYAVDWDRRGRTQRFDVTQGGVTLFSRAVSAFENGVYLLFTASGDVRVTVTMTGPANAVVSGVFFNGGPPPAPVDCQVSAWSAWSAWTPVPGDPTKEQRTRTRTVTQPPSNGGAACPTELSETEVRDTPPAPNVCVQTPLTVTVSSWPNPAAGSRQLRYTSSQPLVGLALDQNLARAVFTDTRGCTATKVK